ncbi:hypothetical protein NMY22_g18526 [Coprinellus aureogranulatus]|nr:hypothetical protein NMY22_g18526 [Coprinellus aureogranulatus]
MPLQRLATELIQHIVDKLGELPREEAMPALIACSTASTNSHTAYNLPQGMPVHINTENLPTNLEPLHKGTYLFLKTIIRNPQLAAYVSHLTYRFDHDSAGDDGTDAVLQSIRELPSIVSLHLGIYTLPTDHGTTGYSIDQERLSVVISVIRHPHFGTLAVDSVLGFPLEIIRASPGLKSLILCDTAVFPGEYGLHPEDVSLLPPLRSLVCDYPSLYYGVGYWLRQGASKSGIEILSRLESLDIVVFRNADYHEQLFGLVESLRELVIKVENYLTIDNGSDQSFISPLRSLNRSSLPTLSRLSYNIATRIAQNPDLERHIVLQDPYVGLCDMPLSDFMSLEHLQVGVHIKGWLGVRADAERSFGSQWGALSEALKIPGAFPNLQTVAVKIEVEAEYCDPQVHPELYRERGATAALFAACLSLAVKPQFRLVEEFCMARKIDFSFMPSQRIATELIQHIVQKLGELPREEGIPALIACSTANSALLETSQKQIFRCVALYSYSHERYDLPQGTPVHDNAAAGLPTNIESLHRSTYLFLGTILRNQRLASYVTDLTYRFDRYTRGDDGTDAVLQAIRQLPAIINLYVGIYNLPTEPRGLGSLTMDSVLGLPLEIIRASPRLETLILRETATFPGEFGLPSAELSMTPRLRNLTCDHASVYEGVGFWLRQGASPSGIAILSHLESLDIAFLVGDDPECHELLLQETGALRTLDFTVLNVITHSNANPQFVPFRLLQHLNPGSISTLVHLSYKATTNLIFDNEPGAVRNIHDPYSGLCDITPLANFTSLEYLQVTVLVQGNLNVDIERSFGEQWGALSRLLEQPGAFPSLKRVKVKIEVDSGYCNPSVHPELYRERRTTSTLFMGCLSFAVKPQFRALEEFCAARGIDFTFRISGITW